MSVLPCRVSAGTEAVPVYVTGGERETHRWCVRWCGWDAFVPASPGAEDPGLSLDKPPEGGYERGTLEPAYWDQHGVFSPGRPWHERSLTNRSDRVPLGTRSAPTGMRINALLCRPLPLLLRQIDGTERHRPF